MRGLLKTTTAVFLISLDRNLILAVGGGGGVYLESYTREARFLTRWDQHLSRNAGFNQSADGTRIQPPGACRRPVLAVCPLLDLVSGGSDGYTRRECRLPPLRLGVWRSVGLHSLGAPSAPSQTWVGRWGGQVTPALHHRRP
jgi:hypothetical protein